uniref:uncharacterized protein LOC117269201 isoform X1 n=1 Tax=Epinephelus lanceolatus TaxID=310571 RepID=UPI0014458DE3|nr:uncharacterized protein LOC117269201 isoform X1 [Epinephelus lanceolatus]
MARGDRHHHRRTTTRLKRSLCPFGLVTPAWANSGTLFPRQNQKIWCKRDSEVVVAVIESPDKTSTYPLRQSELNSLAPHKWLLGETVECYLRAILNKNGLGKRIYLLNHYSAGVIVFGARSDMSNHSLRKVDFDNYDGVIGAINAGNNHWKFLYLHKSNGNAYIMGPMGQAEDKDSANYDNITMAEDVVEAFPLVPQQIQIPTLQKGLKDLRINMAKTILQCSVFSEKDHCSSCGQKYSKGQSQTTKWVECTKCRRWYHPCCVAMSDAEWDEENTAASSKWQCGLC